MIRNGTVKIHDGAEFVVPSGLGSPVHRWPMDEGEGTTIADKIGDADGALDGATWVDDPDYYGGHGTVYDGNNDEAVIDSGRTDITDQGAIFLSLKVLSFDTNETLRYVFTHPDTDNNNRIYAPRLNTQDEVLQFILGENTILNNTRIEANETYRVGTTWDTTGTDNQWRVFINGVQVNSGTFNGLTDANNLPWYIGSLGNLGFHQDCEVDNPVVHNGFVSEDYAAQDYARQPWTDTPVHHNAHPHQLGPDIRPAAVHHDGKTYISGMAVDRGNGLVRHRIRSYNESTGEWSDVTEIDATDRDIHHAPAIEFDGDNRMQMLYGSLHGSNSETVYRAETIDPLDISSWRRSAPDFGTNYSYRQLFISSGEIRVFSRKGSATADSPLHYRRSGDGGDTWNTTTLVDEAHGIYPANAIEDGDQYHLLVGFRGDNTENGFEYLATFTFDTSTGDIIGPDGSTLTPPVNSTDLNGVGGIVSSFNYAYGAGLAFDGDQRLVAYLRDDGGVTDIRFAQWDSGTNSWTKTTVASDTPSDRFFGGEHLNIVVNGSNDYRLLETLWSYYGADNAIGAFDTSDGGASWSNRERVREVGARGLRFIERVRNASQIEWIGVEENRGTGADSVATVGAPMFAFDSDWNIIEPEQPRVGVL